MKELVKDLEKKHNDKEQIRILQEIGSKLINNYVIQIGNLTIEPLLVEAYYFNTTKNSFIDDNCHQNPKQKGRFGKIYQHTKTEVNGGIDICLSPKKEEIEDNYFLSFLIKVARINGKPYKQEAINSKLLKEIDVDAESFDNVLKPIKRKDVDIICVPRKGTHKGKFAHAPLAMLSVAAFKNEDETKAVVDSLENGHKKQWVLAKYALEKVQLNIERACELLKQEGLYKDRIQDEYINSALNYIKEQNN